jgi:hypothetical protein
MKKKFKLIEGEKSGEEEEDEEEEEEEEVNNLYSDEESCLNTKRQKKKPCQESKTKKTLNLQTSESLIQWHKRAISCTPNSATSKAYNSKFQIARKSKTKRTLENSKDKENIIKRKELDLAKESIKAHLKKQKAQHTTNPNARILPGSISKRKLQPLNHIINTTFPSITSPLPKQHPNTNSRFNPHPHTQLSLIVSIYLHFYIFYRFYVLYRLFFLNHFL